MKVLVNYDAAEKPYLGILAHIFRGQGISAVSTAAGMQITDLIKKAKLTDCSAIVLCNTETLGNIVPGKSPTLDAWRGSRLQTEVPILIVNKLAHVHSVSHGKWLLEKDLSKLATIAYPHLPFRYTVLRELADFEQALPYFETAILNAYDIETRTKDIKDKEWAILSPNGEPIEVRPTIITCASWTLVQPDMTYKTFVLPLENYDGPHWIKSGEYEEAIAFMRHVNRIPTRKVMHNGMYDATHSMIYGAEPVNWTLDTMAMAHAEFVELPKSLDFVASLWLPDYIYWKSESDQAHAAKDQEQYWGYNAKDTWYTARNAIAWLQNAPAYARKNYAEKFPLVYPALYCNFEGFRIDQEVRSEKRAASLVQLEKARKRLRTIVADPNFNPGSWQQVQKYVYHVFGARKENIGKSKSGTDEKNLKAVSEQHPLLARVCEEILDYREAQKAIGTYYDFLQKNGRLLWALNPFGTESERMACNSSSLWCGTQVQNIPAYAKQMLIADEGYELFEIDNSQSEARCTAYLAQELALITALEDTLRDFYRTLGTLFFKMPYEEVTTEFRNKVLKKIVHGTNYVMGAGTFIENITAKVLYATAPKLSITIVESAPKPTATRMTLRQFAKLLLDAYHGPFPRVREWYKEVLMEIKTTEQLVSPLGHTRHFFGNIEKDHRMFRSAIAHGPQNLSVTVLNVGFQRVYKELVLPGAGNIRLKAQIHDSILGQYKTELRSYYLPRIRECCNNPVIVHGRELKIPTDIKYGLNWSEADENNPNGTVKFKG